jgi:hypothetical protein
MARTNRSLGTWTLACLIVAGSAACSSTGPTTDAAAQEDGSSDADPCRVPLDAHLPFGGCPLTYSDPSWHAQVCFTPPSTTQPLVVEQKCAGYLLRHLELGQHVWTCYYDPTSKMFAAAYFQDALPDVCVGNAGSYLTVGPDAILGSCESPMTLDMPCGPADAGSN